MLKPYLRHHRLLKTIGWLLPVIVLVLAGSLLHTRNLSNQAFQQFHQEHLLQDSQLVEQALESALLANDWQQVQQIIQNTSQQENTSSIRVVGNSGVILASSNPNETGIQGNIQVSPCSVCHASTQRPSVLRINSEGDQLPLILTANPLDNQLACQGCHQDDGDSLGVLLVAHHATPADAWGKNILWPQTAVALLSLLLLLAAFAFVTYRVMVKPMEQVLQGYLPGTSAEGDYLRQLSHYLENSRGELEKASLNQDFQRRGFSALLSLFESFNEKSTTKDVFQLAVFTMIEVSGFTSVAMRLYDPKRQAFDLLAQHGMSPEMVEELRTIPANRGFQQEVLLKKKPVSTTNLAQDPRLGGKSPLDSGYQSLVSIPLLAADQVVGTVELASKEAHAWSEDEIRWLELVGRSVGNLVSIVQLSEKVRSLAVMQERTRLSQEIHDGLAQLVGSLRVWAEETRLAADDGDLQTVQTTCSKIEQAARDAYASLREEMLELRDTVVPGKDIIPVLSEYLSRFQRNSGIKTRLVLDKTLKQQPALQLPPQSEIQLLRIIQEALTNVRKHAGAKLASVSLSLQENWLVVNIQDDGAGFSLDQVSSDSLGLRIMRERAASIDGEIELLTSPGEGTTLTVRLPILTIHNEELG